MATPFSRGEFEDPSKVVDDPNKDVPDEFKTMSKADMAKMIKAKDDQVKDLSGKVTEVLTEVQTIRKSTEEKNKPPVVADAEPDPYAKPREYVDHKLREMQQRKIDPLVAAYLTRQESDTLAAVLAKPHMKDYKDEVEKVIKGAGADAKVHPAFADEVYKYVRGAHFDEIVEKAKKEQERQPEFTEVGTSAGARRPNSSPEGLNADEKRAAEGLGMSEDKYIAWKKDRGEMGDKMVTEAQAKRGAR